MCHDQEQVVIFCQPHQSGPEQRVRPKVKRTSRLFHQESLGRGLSFTEGRFDWHARVATADEVASARAELGSADRSS